MTPPVHERPRAASRSILRAAVWGLSVGLLLALLVQGLGFLVLASEYQHWSGVLAELRRSAFWPLWREAHNLLFICALLLCPMSVLGLLITRLRRIALAVLIASLLQLVASAGLVAGWLKVSGQWWVLHERD